MAESKRLTWDDVGKREYEAGCDRGVLYPMQEDGSYGVGEAWHGLRQVDENPSGADETKLWANNGEYLSLRSAEEFGITIQAFTYPESFTKCDGSAEFEKGITIGQQTRQKFGFTYRSLKGNDTKQTDYGYKIKLVYGCSASPSEKSHSTINEDQETVEFSWECSTTPVLFDDKFKPTSIVEIDSNKVNPKVLKAIEDCLYGTETTDPKFPTPAELKELITSASAG